MWPPVRPQSSISKNRSEGTGPTDNALRFFLFLPPVAYEEADGAEDVGSWYSKDAGIGTVAFESLDTMGRPQGNASMRYRICCLTVDLYIQQRCLLNLGALVPIVLTLDTLGTQRGKLVRYLRILYVVHTMPIMN